MKRHIQILAILIVLCQFSQAQIDDKFDYDSLSQNPAWTGDTEYFIIENSRLRSNLEQTNSSFYISRNAIYSDTTEWLIQMELKFNTSSANYVDWFLMADSENLLNSQNAYFVRIGNTADEVSLYKKVNGQAQQILIDGTDNILNRSNNPLTVRVIRFPDGKWTLEINSEGLLEPMSSEGEIIDSELGEMSFTGILIRQSTASFFQKHYFDLFYMGKEIRDSVPPRLLSSKWIGDDSIHLVFNEELDSISAVDFSNFIITPSNPISSLRLLDDKMGIGLNLEKPLTSLTHYKLNISGIKDLEGNKMRDTAIEYLYLKPEKAQAFDLIINEIMSSPEPSAGLPEFQYLEIFNRSDKVINLKNFMLSDRTSTAKIDSFLLLPDSFLILCPNKAVSSLAEYGNCLGVTSFPSLNKTSDEIYLRNPEGTLIYSVFYTSEWYRDKVKSSGGFSLEMIDLNNPCTGFENWSASINKQGGTPGFHNSVRAENPDLKQPVLLSAYPLSDALLELRFDEQIDSISANDYSEFIFNESEFNNPTITKNSFVKIHLQLPISMERNKVYSLTVRGLEDCAGNIIDETVVQFGLPEKMQRNDLLINEILFNPPTDLSEFVEVYNNSSKIFDLKELRIGNLKDDGALRDFVSPAPEGHLIFPAQYIAFSKSGMDLCSHYNCEIPQNIFKVNSLPSYPQKSGGVVLADYSGLVIDSFLYNEKMHFQLIKNPKGVSLERVEFNRSTTDKDNWTSASGNIGYATPGYKNSQAITPTTSTHKVWLDSDVFSPDGDGIDDKLNLRFELDKSGFTANVYVYNSSGVFVTQAVYNTTLNSSGVLTWDGFYENSNNRCPLGIYVILFEAFHEEGDIIRKKIACTLLSKY